MASAAVAAAAAAQLLLLARSMCLPQVGTLIVSLRAQLRSYSCWCKKVENDAFRRMNADAILLGIRK